MNTELHKKTQESNNKKRITKNFLEQNIWNKKLKMFACKY